MSKNETFRWEFTQDLKGGHRGFNNPDLERFKNGRYRSLSREVIQNSIDAVLDKSKPVRVEFDLSTKPISDLPDREGLLKKVTACIPMAELDKNRAEAAVWFKNAKAILEGQKIDILRMSDYNTKGMRGPCEYGTPFYAYMKAMGTSEKEDASAAGSHGIGKRAPLLSSKLRSIFAVTKYNDLESDSKSFLTQGFSLLMTHEETSPTGKKIRIDAEGFWGDPEGCLPSSDPESLPKWMRREEVGTDLYLLAFDRAPHWRDKIVALTATNYFAAFARGTLEVKVQDAEINKQTIGAILANNQHYEDCLDDKQDKFQLQYTKYFYEAMDDCSPEIIIEKAELPHLGQVEMRIIVRDGLPQEYAVIRANMLIITELPDLKRFPNYKDFIAVIECKSKEGEALLRSIEPSRHDSFEIDQLESEDLKRKARVAVSKLVEFVRRSLKKHAREPMQSAGSVGFLSQFLADDTSSGHETGEAEINPAGKIILTPKPLATKPTTKTAESNTTGESDKGDDSDVNKGFVHTDSTTETTTEHPEKEATGPGNQRPGVTGNVDTGGHTGSEIGGNMKNLAGSPRVIENSSGKHSLSFTAPKAKNYRVSVRAVGLDFEEPLPVIESNVGVIQGGTVIVEANKGERVRLEVALSRASLGSYRLVCEEIL